MKQLLALSLVLLTACGNTTPQVKTYEDEITLVTNQYVNKEIGETELVKKVAEIHKRQESSIRAMAIVKVGNDNNRQLAKSLGVDYDHVEQSQRDSNQGGDWSLIGTPIKFIWNRVLGLGSVSKRRKPMYTNKGAGK